MLERMAMDTLSRKERSLRCPNPEPGYQTELLVRRLVHGLDTGIGYIVRISLANQTLVFRRAEKK